MTIHRPLVSVFAALAVATSLWAPAARAQVAPESRNAALKYWAAVVGMPKESRDAVSSIDWDKLEAAKDESGIPPDVKKLMDELRPTSEQVLAASKLSKCDFEPETEKGFETLLPHLGNLRMLARAMRLEARHQLILGNPDAASEYIAGLFRMGAQIKSDRYLISALVGTAIGKMACIELETLLKHATLSSDARQKLIESITALGNDPFGIRAAVVGERDFTCSWLRALIRQPERGEAVARKLSLIFDGNTPPTKSQQELVRLVSAMDAEQFEPLIAEAEQAYTDFLALWDHQGTEAETTTTLRDIEQRIEQGKYGPLSQYILPSIGKCYRTDLDTKKSLATAVEQIKANGATPLTATPPASATAPAK